MGSVPAGVGRCIRFRQGGSDVLSDPLLEGSIRWIPVTAAQYLILKDSFARKGVNINATYTPAGDIDYIYVVDRLLARGENVEQLLAAMPGLRRADANEQPEVGRSRPASNRSVLDRSGRSWRLDRS